MLMRHDVMAVYGYYSWHLDTAMENHFILALSHFLHRVYSRSDDVICDSLRKSKFLEEHLQFDVFGSSTSLMVGRVKFITDTRVGWVHNAPNTPLFAVPTSVTCLCNPALLLWAKLSGNYGCTGLQKAMKLGLEMGLCVCLRKMVFQFFLEHEVARQLSV